MNKSHQKNIINSEANHEQSTEKMKRNTMRDTQSIERPNGNRIDNNNNNKKHETNRMGKFMQVNIIFKCTFAMHWNGVLLVNQTSWNESGQILNRTPFEMLSGEIHFFLWQNKLWFDIVIVGFVDCRQ